MTIDNSISDNIIDTKQNIRILIVDDNKDIHDDFKLILDSSNAKQNDDELDFLLEQVLNNKVTPSKDVYQFQLDSAFQGQEALKLVEKAYQEGDPYSIVFIDIRMPPGWNGIKTIQQIWNKFPQLEMVICTAYSDYSWEEINQTLGGSHHLLILKKPFDRMEVKQLALSLSVKSIYLKKHHEQIIELKETIKRKTQELENKD